MRFSVNFDDIATGAAADTFRTLVALIAPNTAGYRCRLMALTIGPADNAPVDLNAAVQLKRIDALSSGSVGTPSATTPVPTQKDSLSRASVITRGTDYSGGEPTTYGNVLWQADLNRRNTLVKEWSPEDAPVVNRDQLLGLLVAPRTAAAARLSGSLEFEEF